MKGKGLTREILIEKIIYPNGTLAAAPTDGLKGWETDLTLRVAMPDGNSKREQENRRITKT